MPIDMTHRRRPMPTMLIGAGLGAAGIAVLLLVGSMIGPMPFDFDTGIILGLRRWGGPDWLPRAAVDVTALGGGTVLTIIVLIVAGLLAVERLWLTAGATIAASLTGGWAVDAVKALVGRSRPDIVPHLVQVGNTSFPSGHAANSAVVYLTLAGLASQVMPDRIARRYMLAVAILLVGAIGCSRVYLGVHWPSDVLAGWSFGTLWALGWWLATEQARASLGGER